jgi:hypothetical protein
LAAHGGESQGPALEPPYGDPRGGPGMGGEALTGESDGLEQRSLADS